LPLGGKEYVHARHIHEREPPQIDDHETHWTASQPVELRLEDRRRDEI
jgi:hypothetical protein